MTKSICEYCGQYAEDGLCSVCGGSNVPNESIGFIPNIYRKDVTKSLPDKEINHSKLSQEYYPKTYVNGSDYFALGYFALMVIILSTIGCIIIPALLIAGYR